MAVATSGKPQLVIKREVVKTKQPIFYCLDQSGIPHFGQTQDEAMAKAVSSNKEMRWH